MDNGTVNKSKIFLGITRAIKPVFFELQKCNNLFIDLFRFIKPKHTGKQSKNSDGYTRPRFFIREIAKRDYEKWSDIPTPLIMVPLKYPIEERFITHHQNENDAQCKEYCCYNFVFIQLFLIWMFVLSLSAKKMSII